MSSLAVRTLIKDLLEDELPEESVIDLTSTFDEIKDLVADNDVQPDSPWLGLEFLGDNEEPIQLAAGNETGLYRETGAVYFHVVDVARLGNGNGLLTRGERLRNLLRGRRIGNLLVESITPMNFEAGATLQFEGGYMSGSCLMSYQYDFSLD